MTNSRFDAELRKFLIKAAFHPPLEKPPFGTIYEILLNDLFGSFIYSAAAEDKEV